MDPYQWLEEIQSPQALEWVHSMNAPTLAVLESDPRYEPLREHYRSVLTATDRIPSPQIRGQWIYNFWQDTQHVRGIYRRTPLQDFATPSPQWETVLDLDALAAKEGENWVWKGLSCLAPDHELCLVMLSRGGQDAVVVREFDLKNKEFVQNGFYAPEAKTEISWMDRDTVLIGTDFGPGSLTDSGYAREVRIWKRGTPVKAAKPLFEGKTTDVVVWSHNYMRPSGAVRLVVRMPTFYTMEAFVLSDDLSLRKLVVPEDSEIAGVFGDRVLIRLRSRWNHSGGVFKQGSLLAIRIAGGSFPEIVYEPSPNSTLDVQQSVETTEDRLLVRVLTDVRSEVLSFPLQSSDRWVGSRVPLPEDGTLGLISADSFRKEWITTHESYLTPTTQYWVEADAQGALQVRQIRSLPSRFNESGTVETQLLATSKDGTQIPYSLIHRSDLKFDGSAPTLLYGYGGFEIALTPYYLSTLGKPWIEKGGVYVVANIRGGGECGPSWHHAALKENRQKAFDDFIAVAEDLIARKITSSRQLGIRGGSNGGLLVGAVFTQRPELFNAVLCQVPLLDMLRYHLLLAGASWMAEYGDPEDPDMRPIIEAYSPYQNVHAGVNYPKVFFMTSTLDDRVHPGHARKMAAKMVEQGHDILYFENTEGGHSAAANIEQQVKLRALESVYFYQQLMD